MLKAAWKGKRYSSVLKSTVKIPLLVGSPLLPPPPGVCDYIAGKPVVASPNVGCFVRLVGWRRGGGGAQATGISGGHLRLDGSIARICKKFVMPPPIIGQQQRINHCPFCMYGTIIHPVILFTSGWCPTTHFGSAANASGWNRKCFCRTFPHSSFVEVGFAPLYWTFPAL